MAVDDVVVVTGFGPFSTFTDNPSSRIVDELEKRKIPGFNGRLVTEKMNCLYEEVDKTVKRLWKEYSPKLMVHIGLHSSIHRQINLERQSFGRGYCSYDNNGCVPTDNVCSMCSEPILKTTIDCNAIASQVERDLDCEDLKIVASDDPGRFLCAYSFYLSLSFDADRAIFVHVPPFDSVCTIEVITTAIQKTILAILKSFDAS
ncbi:unnamed protein product [Nippostrongylus brasiliensis]|uniref:Pyroglutamyl-peptidase I (inferred by orthology to a S. mansoni protein) n=1 Tax=Nippostrongylus brasiliensis TaxID=27835 RepID=A0A0N4XVD2_NIPBR|nr:unnamed protein product [Nippostrongylus brasiliensis]